MALELEFLFFGKSFSDGKQFDKITREKDFSSIEKFVGKLFLNGGVGFWRGIYFQYFQCSKVKIKKVFSCVKKNPKDKRITNYIIFCHFVWSITFFSYHKLHVTKVLIHFWSLTYFFFIFILVKGICYVTTLKSLKILQRSCMRRRWNENVKRQIGKWMKSSE